MSNPSMPDTHGNADASQTLALVEEIERLRREGTPGVMHAVDRAFYDLVVKERDAARAAQDRVVAERDAAKATAAVRGGEWCAQNRAEGRGPCGACAWCCQRERERADRSERALAELRRVAELHRQTIEGYGKEGRAATILAIQERAQKAEIAVALLRDRMLLNINALRNDKTLSMVAREYLDRLAEVAADGIPTVAFFDRLVRVERERDEAIRDRESAITMSCARREALQTLLDGLNAYPTTGDDIERAKWDHDIAWAAGKAREAIDLDSPNAAHLIAREIDTEIPQCGSEQPATD